ncbi:MAG: FtsW/RodA/SpoVE family cell cycle protein [Candidatus Helarchaeota archaeon]|nr:FtsW/RodA/SpoVE family cell cycle protein [Candidatus Helarchaeota archaeon]
MKSRYELYLIILSVILTSLAHFEIYYSAFLTGDFISSPLFIRNISIMLLFLIVYVVLKVMKFRGNYIPLIAVSFLTGICLSLNYRFVLSSPSARLFSTFIISLIIGILSIPIIIFYFRNNRVAKLKRRYYLLFGITIFCLFVWSVISNIIGERFLFSRTPWELAKIPIVFVIAGFLSEYSIIFVKKKNLFVLILIIICPILFLWIIPQMFFVAMGDLGQIVIFSLFILFLFFAVSEKFVYFFGGFSFIFFIIYIIPFLCRFLPEYAVERFEIWSDFWNGFPSTEWFSIIYQPLNSLFAVHSGGLFGAGFGMGYPELIPKSGTDFVYSVLAEEIGFVGTFSLIVIYFSLLISGLITGFKCSDNFVRYSVLGFSIIIGVQTFVNIAGVINLIPLTGIPLPFLSKGGFAYLTFSFMVGFIMSASKMENFNHPECSG